jgi:hypothetical protein
VELIKEMMPQLTRVALLENPDNLFVRAFQQKFDVVAQAHIGEVVVRSIGSDLRKDYSAVGPTTHMAGRNHGRAPSFWSC